MTKRLFVVGLLILFAVFTTNAFAATKARTASYAQGIQQVDGIADLSSGDSMEVDSYGSAQVKTGDSIAESVTGESGTLGHQIVTGAGNLQKIIISGPATSAGNYMLVYDNTSATGTPLFEITVGVAKDTNVIDCDGAIFSTGLYVVTSADEVFGTVIYN